MQMEIGSNFWLDPAENISSHQQIDLKPFGISGSDSVFLSTGRGAEAFVLETMAKRHWQKRKVALIPPFTCHTVIEPFLTYGYTIHAYPVDEHLSTTPDMLRQAIETTEPSVVLLHRYFGFDTLQGCESLIDEKRRAGIVFIEDRTQNIFSDIDSLPTDYTIGSLRKWAGLPDGGYAFCREGVFENKPQEYDEILTEKKLSASYAKYLYLFNGEGEKSAFLQQYKIAEQILDEEDKFYKISPVSEAVFCNLNVEELKQRRRTNYKILYDALKTHQQIRVLMPPLADEVVPLYFAMWVNDRALLQQQLCRENIYAPVVWPIADAAPPVCDAAKDLYDHILCIPIDQRYDIDDMERVVDSIK